MASISEHSALEVYEWYSDLERRLLDIVQVVPFIEYSELESIRSPRLASVLLEAASLVDTLFRNLMPSNFLRPDGKEAKALDANIIDYRRVLEPKLNLASSQSLLLRGLPTLISPFSPWKNTNQQTLSWWKSYNNIKHNRLDTASEVSMAHCIGALCALNQLMLKIDPILKLVFRFGWADVGGYNPTLAIRDLKNPDVVMGYVAYTEFFATFLKPVKFSHVDEIRPIMFRNSQRLQAHLGRLGTKTESE